MMRKQRVHILLLALVFFTVAFGCGSSNSSSNELPVTGGYSYEIKTYTLATRDNCSAGSTGCATYRVQYPAFAGLAAQVEATLTTSMHQAVSTGNPEEKDQSFQGAAKGFIRSYNFFHAVDTSASAAWYFLGDISVEVNTDTLISLRASTEFYTGGAHGGTGVYFVNIDPATGRELMLDDFMRTEDLEHLHLLGEEEFRRQNKIDEGVSLAEAGFEFPDDTFSLNNNFGFMADGLHFVFNAYEIAPFAMGSQEVVLTYAEIMPLMHARKESQ